MSNNYIALYTLAPDVTTAAASQNYTTPPIIKLQIEWDGKNQFTKYNIPVENSSLLKTYITYNINIEQPATLYKKSIWNITGQTMGLSNTQSIYGSAIFDYKTADDIEIPQSCFIDFSEFNKINYYITKGIKTSNTTTYKYTKYMPAYLNSSNYIVRDSSLNSAEVAMRNFVWFNPDCTVGGAYICADVLSNYVLNTYYLVTVTPNDISITNYNNLINQIKEVIGEPVNYTKWPINIINDTNHTVIPVAINNNPTKSLFNYDFKNYKIFINGFNDLFKLSKYAKREYINNEPWVYKFQLANGFKSLLNPNGYFNIQETLPVRYKVKTINASNSIFELNQDFNSFPNINSNNILWKTLKNNLYYKLCFTIATTNNKYSSLLVDKQFFSAYLNPFETPNTFVFNTSSLLYNKKRLDCTNILQLALPSSTQYNDTITISNNNYNSQSRLELLLNYTFFKYKHSDNNKSYYGVEYNLNGDTNITYLDIINKAYWFVNPQGINNAPSINEQFSVIPADGLLFNEAITCEKSNIITTCFTDTNNVDNSYVNLSISYNYKYNDKTFHTTSIIPFVEANVPYNVQKIEFKINGKSVNINSSEARDFIDVYSNNTYYGVNSNYTSFYANISDDNYLTPANCVINQINKYNTYLLNVSYYSYTNNNINTNNIDIKLTSNFSTTKLPDEHVIDKYWWCNISYNQSNISKEDNIKIYIDNQHLHINNLNYQNYSDQTISINFELVTPKPDYATYYYFKNNTTHPETNDLTVNTFIIGDNNIYNNYNDFKYVLNNSNEYFLKTNQSKNTYNYITIIPGSNTNINNTKYTYIFNPIQSFNIFAEVTGVIAEMPITSKLNNDGNLILNLPHYVNVDNKNAYAYLDVDNIVGSSFNSLINIGTYNNNEQQLNNLLTYYETAGKSEAYITVHIDDNNEPISLLNNSVLFSNTPINIYTKLGSNNKLSLKLSYINDETENSSLVQTITSNNFNVCSVVSSVTPGATPKLNNDIYFINGLNFNNKSLLNFNININENNNIINLDTVSIVPDNNEVAYLKSTANVHNNLNQNYNYWLVKNRFINNSNNIAFNDIRNEILKNISLKYYHNMYLVNKYNGNIGIDIYFHNYVTNQLDNSLYNYDYTNSYNGKNVSHYGFVKKFDLSNQLNDIKINNLYYRIYNNINNAVNINNKSVLQNNYIDIPITTDVSLTDIIKLNNSSYNSFISALESTKKSLTAVINNIDITTTDKLKISVNDGWKANNNETTSGIRPITLNDIIKDETIKYSFNSNIIIGSINLSDIVTITERDTIYIQPIHLGITSEKIFIWENDDKKSFNTEWINLLNYINNITTYDLTKYEQIQITGFKLNNWDYKNTSVVYSYGNQNGKTIDQNAINAIISTTTQLKTEYNLYNTNNYLQLVLQDIKQFSNLPTKYNYVINLANQTVILQYKLISSNQETESTIRFRITNNSNYSQVTKSSTLGANNIIDFGTLYITDKNLNNIYNTEPGYLTFKSLSENKHDEYKVTISFCTDTEILPTTYSFVVGDKDYNFGLKEYIINNKNDSSSVFHGKDISYIMIKQIVVDPEGSKKEADKYYLNID